MHCRDEDCAGVADARIGTVVSDKYEIIRVLGRGGMGKVYEARHVQVGRRVALKFLFSHLGRDSDATRRFEKEARAAGSLEHENIAGVYDWGQDADGARFLVMEFVAGQDCQKLLEREGPLPVQRAANLALQVCRGVHAAHRFGIIHRDLKPANLLLTKRADGTDLVKIVDFGIAKLQSEADGSETASGFALGTAHYMSPEQARGEKSVDQRTDVYAIGAILYEFLSGKRPHVGDSYLKIIYSILHDPPEPLENLRPGLPAGLPAAVVAAMHADPDRRTPSVAELGEALIPYSGVASEGPIRTEVVKLPPPRREEAGVPRPSLSPHDSLGSHPKSLDGSLSTNAPVVPDDASRVAPGTRSLRRSWGLAVLGGLAVAALTAWGVSSRSARVDHDGQREVVSNREHEEPPPPITPALDSSSNHLEPVSPDASVSLASSAEQPSAPARGMINNATAATPVRPVPPAKGISLKRSPGF